MDSAGAGSEINCPSCGEKIVIPQAPSVPQGGAPAHGGGHQPINPIAASAAAKVEMHLKVPVRATPTEMLIEKPLVPLEAAKEKDRHIRIKSIRHTDCIEVGHDRFDEIVSNFLGKVGEANIVNISSFSYTFLDIGTQKLMTEYGVLIVYKG